MLEVADRSYRDLGAVGKLVKLSRKLYKASIHIYPVW